MSNPNKYEDKEQGTNSNDVIKSYDNSSSVIVGLDGNDKIYAGAKDDLVIGGDGNDLIVGGKGNDVLKGGHGNDTMRGGTGDDVLLASHGDNRMHGGADNDRLIIGSGKNVVSGGGGEDKFVFTDKFGGHGNSTVLDFNADEDVLMFSSESIQSFSDLEISYDARGNAVLSNGEDFTVKVKGLTQEEVEARGSDLFVF
ncbi:calcium-binding protein [Vibrio rotiferianus]|uniref:calcium-binding protein n=1 Tax=Vibrio rotiferianus TaxID=190895 RepID=UPI0011107E22|nr:calcium-binding protein [Vibrio rotiferianus]TMX30975.1 calcium-binding protein [Vibrio rotiferianus]TMX43423.1 calcium-binding protein [Vibrio rotiferianus]TMX59660.1 calcium-binding protein [Vibrio rotiferianus]